MTLIAINPARIAPFPHTPQRSHVRWEVDGNVSIWHESGAKKPRRH